jgi:hypothetical protein
MDAFCEAHQRFLNSCDVNSGFASIDFRSFTQLMANDLLHAFEASGKINCRVFLNATLIGRVRRGWSGYEFVPAN